MPRRRRENGTAPPVGEGEHTPAPSASRFSPEQLDRLLALVECLSQIDADRIEPLIAANEHTANAINRLAQELQEARRKRSTSKAPRARRVPTRKVVVTDRADALANAALARHRDLP